jgi:WD40 repeat protein
LLLIPALAGAATVGISVWQPWHRVTSRQNTTADVETLRASALPPPADGSPITAVAPGVDGLMAVGTLSGRVEIRKGSGLAPGDNVVQALDEPIIAVAISGDGKVFAASGRTMMYVGAVAEPEADAVRFILTEYDSDTWEGAFALDQHGTRLAIGGNSLSIHDTRTGRRIASFDQPNPQNTERAPYEQVAFSPDGSRLLATDYFFADIFDLQRGSLVRSVQCRCQWSPDTRLLVEGGSDGHLRVWDATTGAVSRNLTVLIDPKDYFLGTVASDQGQLYSYTSDGALAAWGDGKSAAAQISLDAAGESVGGSIAISPDSRYLLVGLSDGEFMEDVHQYEAHYWVVQTSTVGSRSRS